MKIKRKGKIHPSPPQLQAEASSNSEDFLAVLNLLPATILALVAALSLQDREVVAYLITRSLKTTTTNSIKCSSPSPRKLYRNDKQMESIIDGGAGSYHHKTAVFDCGCFECYTSFWLRWDSSPNRELIHEVIESFEEHLANGELQTKRSSNRRTIKKEKLPVQKLEKVTPAVEVVTFTESLHFEVSEKEAEVNPKAAEVVEEEVVRIAAEGHKGFARKVFPDVMEVFNSRLWNLWSQNV